MPLTRGRLVGLEQSPAGRGTQYMKFKSGVQVEVTSTPVQMQGRGDRLQEALDGWEKVTRDTAPTKLTVICI